MTKAAGVARRSAAGSRTALTLMTRLGYGARGLIYLLVGGFAIAAAAGGGHAHGIGDALAAIDNTPLRLALSVLFAVRLSCFAGHLTFTGLRDWARIRGPRHWLVAAGILGDAAIYGGFVVAVLGVAFGGHGGEGRTQGWTAWLMPQPFGRGLVGVVGLAVFGCGVGLVLWAATADLERDLGLPRSEKRVFEPVARYGIGGRGVAIALVGVYRLLAAVNGDPSQAHALGGALETLRQHGFGWLLLPLGLAFVASAGFDLLEAAFRRAEPA